MLIRLMYGQKNREPKISWMVTIRWVLQKLLQKNQVINSYFETKSNPFSIFNKNIDGINSYFETKSNPFSIFNKNIDGIIGTTG